MTALDPKTLRTFAEETVVKTRRGYSIIEKDYWVVCRLYGHCKDMVRPDMTIGEINASKSPQP